MFGLGYLTNQKSPNLPIKKMYSNFAKKTTSSLILKNKFKKYSKIPSALSDLGKNVFSESVLRNSVAPEVYEAFVQAKGTGKALDKPSRNAIARSMQKWAMERGCV